ncbi:TetR/AcrR family transcriptional regulator [Nocardia sp. NPDC060220]|uniref:TetR/AcrR family transcriptional regulator n=1 Tax=Nocardia sp. NPDC060220 TaxID=3347076 RepID=UPI00365B4118
MTAHSLSRVNTDAHDESRPAAARRATRGRAASEPAAGAQSTSRRELVEREIMEQATILFAEKGFAGTTLQDIAKATGLTRPALYHYVANKDDLLARLVTEIAEQPAQILRKINERADLDPAQRLREMAMSIALHQLAAPDRFRLLLRSEAELPDALANTYRNSKRRVLKEFIAVIDDGIRAGQFYPADSRTAAFGIIGMLNWIAFWHHPGQDDGPAAAAQLADMAMRTVVDPAADTNGQGGPRRILERLRQNLDSLEQTLGAI